MPHRNQQFLLAARPEGELKHSDFELVEAPVPEAGEGEVLVEARYLAVEPAMKCWMEAREDYVAPMEIGEVMRGNVLGSVVASRNKAYPEGSLVMGLSLIHI